MNLSNFIFFNEFIGIYNVKCWSVFPTPKMIGNIFAIIVLENIHPTDLTWGKTDLDCLRKLVLLISGLNVYRYFLGVIKIAVGLKMDWLVCLKPVLLWQFNLCFTHYSVDATKETSRLGRLINHSKTGNCQTRLHAIDGNPHLILVASRDIKAEEELLYDYGDRSKASVLAHPWLKYWNLNNRKFIFQMNWCSLLSCSILCKRC